MAERKLLGIRSSSIWREIQYFPLFGAILRFRMGFLGETLFFVENSVDFLCMFAFRVVHRQW